MCHRDGCSPQTANKTTNKTKNAMKRNILLSPDSIDGGDPLDTNVNDIDTSYPRLPAGLYDLKIGEVKKEPTKDHSGERLTIPMATVSEHTSTKGEPILPGLVITHYIGITPKPAAEAGKREYTNAEIAKAVAGIGKAAGLSCSVRDIINNPAQLNGRVVRCKIKIQKETDEFPESNRIADFVVVK